MSRGSKAGPAAVDPFYAEAFSVAERMSVPRAQEAEGLEEEILLLRVRLLGYARERPDQFELLLKGVGTLARAAATHYRLSPDAKQDLESSIAGVLEGVGRGLGLGEFGGGGGA